MNKSLLIKHICGETSQQEESEVLQWISKSADNKRYYANLKNIIVRGTLPDTQADSKELEDIHWTIYRREQKKRVEFKKLFIFSCTIAAAAVVLLVYILVPFKSAQEPLDEYTRILLSDIPKQYTNTIYTENGVKGKIALPDSSVVMLNSASSITYPNRFCGDTREITFSGEGYFDIKPDSLSPMVIKTDKGIDVIVYGTEFNLNTFHDKLEATLYSGKITLVSGSEKDGTLSVTEMKPLTKSFISVSDTPRIISLTKDVDIITTAWTKGQLIFDSTPLQEVIEELERWHGVEIVVEDKSILNFKITGKFKSESIVQIADFIKYCSLVDYDYSDKVLYLKAR